MFAQCLLIHKAIKGPIERGWRVPVLYTIGHYEESGSLIYRRTEEELQQLLQYGVIGGQVKLHAWLTLPSLEIIDISLSTTIGVVKNIPELIGVPIISHEDELREKGIKYHPMLLGEEYLEKIGAM